MLFFAMSFSSHQSQERQRRALRSNIEININDYLHANSSICFPNTFYYYWRNGNMNRNRMPKLDETEMKWKKNYRNNFRKYLLRERIFIHMFFFFIFSYWNTWFYWHNCRWWTSFLFRHMKHFLFQFSASALTFDPYILFFALSLLVVLVNRAPILVKQKRNEFFLRCWKWSFDFGNESVQWVPIKTEDSVE